MVKLSHLTLKFSYIEKPSKIFKNPKLKLFLKDLKETIETKDLDGQEYVFLSIIP